METLGMLIGTAIALAGLWLTHGFLSRLSADAPAAPAGKRGADAVEAELPFGARLREALSKSRDGLRRSIDAVLGDAPGFAEALLALEEALVAADVGVVATRKLLDRVRAEGAGPADELRARLRRAVRESLEFEPPAARPESGPQVILVSGVNGVGKTTSVAKLAAYYRENGLRVLLVAADTFRAGAIDQLEVWAGRAGVDMVRHQAGADPAAVAHDGMAAAKSRGVDVVLVDTAGRLHTRHNLMEELRKIARVVAREVPGAPHEAWLVIDGTTGQNAVRQAQVFRESIGLTGVIVTKLDGTARGGAALAVREELGLPIRFVGIGERLEDLRPFNADDFVAGLLGDGPPLS